MELLEEEFPSVSPKRNILRPVFTTGLKSASGDRPVLGRLAVDPQLSSQIPRYAYGHEERELSPEEVEELLEIRRELELEIKQNMLSYIRSLNLDLDIQAIQERLEKATLHLFPGAEDLGHQGWYEAEKRLAVAKIHNNPELRKYDISTIVHELFHAASGQVFRQTGLLYSGEKVFSHRIIGMERYPHERIDWLNEAVTSKLQDMFLKQEYGEGGTSYPVEKAVLNEIIKVSGVPFGTFIEAYFEEPDLDAAPGERMPKWRQLQQRLNDRFGPRFLQRVRGLKYDNSDNFTGFYKKDQNGRTGLERMFRLWQDTKKQYGEEKARQNFLEYDTNVIINRKKAKEESWDY